MKVCFAFLAGCAVVICGCGGPVGTPDDAAVLYSSSNVQAALQVSAKGNHQSGLELLNSVDSKNRHEEALLELLRGSMARKAGNFHEAIIHLSKSIDLNPQQADAYCQRAFAYQQNAEPQWEFKSMTDAEMAIQIDSKLALAHLLLGKSFLAVEDYQKAITSFSNGIRWNPKSYTSYANRAAAYALIGNIHQANRDIQTALEFDIADQDMEAILDIEAMIAKLTFRKDKHQANVF